MAEPFAPLPVQSPVLTRQAARRRAIEQRRKRARIRRNRLVAGLGCTMTGVVAFTAVHAASGSGSDRHVMRHVQLTSIVTKSSTIPGTISAIPWPAKGQGAVAVAGLGVMARTSGERPVPIASLTKMMTAYIILKDHPIAPGAMGPSFRMTAADVAAYVQADQTDESNAPVQLGEVLNEYQLLEALMLPSADNIADFFATWDAGSIPKFVAKMNATAHSLGLHQTHYADASGVNPASQSTAGDQADLAAKLMQIPVIRTIVDRPQVAFPVAGTLWNVNPALGHNGIVGVKSGYTSEAMGCLATAAWHSVGSKSVLVVAVTLGQPDGLYGAANVDEGLLAKADSTLVAYRPIPKGVGVASVTVPWSSESVQVGLLQDATVVGWPGLKIKEAVIGAPATASVAQSGTVGRVEFIVRKTVAATSDLSALSPLPAAPAGWNPTS